jgi:hypothetical protein
MPTLLIGAIVAAASNLLYADLAFGAPYIDAFARTLGLDTFGQDLRMVRLSDRHLRREYRRRPRRRRVRRLPVVDHVARVQRGPICACCRR